MAWYTINYTCGHTDRIQLYGKEDARQRIVAAKERCMCPECEAAEANKAAEGSGLSILIGTPKQVSWASDIRDRWLDDHLVSNLTNLVNSLTELIAKKTLDTDRRAAMLSTALAMLGADPDPANYDPVKAEAGYRRQVSKFDQAKWWIDNRGSFSKEILRSIVSDAQQQGGTNGKE